MTDKNLWAEIQRGDNRAFKELFERYYRQLCSFTVQFTQSMPEAEDIVQDVFIKLWTKRNEISINSALKGYLYRSTRNDFIDRARKDKRKDEFMETLKYDLMNSNTEDENYLLEKKIQKIKKLVDKLPKKCKEVLLLSKKHGYKNKEIAEQLNISLKTVESQISIAFKKIRKDFNNDDFLLFLLLKDQLSEVS